MKFVAAVLLCLAGSAHAEAFISGAQLVKACTGKAPADRAACDGFVAGAMDQVQAAPELKGKLCLPGGTKLGVLREGVGRYASSHADAAKGSAVALVDDMVRAEYPCPNK